MRTVRPWRPADREACLSLFDSNVPRFFTASERDDFSGFLDDLPGPFLVVEADGRVVACGGVAREEDGMWSVCWTVVDRARHGRGLGTRLMDALTREVLGQASGAASDPVVMRLETVPRTEPFFLRRGFHTVNRIPDHYGPGLDRLEMRRHLRRHPFDPRDQETGP